MNHLVGQLLLREAWTLDATTRTGKEIFQKVLLYSVELSDTHVDHITVFDAKIVQFGCIVCKQLLTEEQLLLLHIGLARHSDQAL